MRFLIALVVALFLIIACARPLKRHPAPFYLVAFALVVFYALKVNSSTNDGIWPYFMPLIQRCALAFLLFSIVMFIGVFREGSSLRAKLMPIRRQLSILGCIFATGHIVFYATSYFPRIVFGYADSLMASLLLAVLLVVLMAALMITSFQVIKRRMNAQVWKRVQRLAYPFYLLIYLHLAMFLIPSAIAGKDTAIISLTVYTIMILTYVILRIRKAVCQKESRLISALADAGATP